MTNKTDMPEVIYAGMARDLDGNEIGGYWQEEPQGEPKYILADTSISKAKHLEAMKAQREACLKAYKKWSAEFVQIKDPVDEAILSATIEWKE